MTEEATTPKLEGARRVFEQPIDAISIYAEYVQVLGTENEVILQFYDMVPGLPDATEKTVRTRLRANIAMAPMLATKLADLLAGKRK